MTDPSKAVFLSYASQDVAAARQICDALRSEGIPVWFDADGGLEHGDEWDWKIRQQIKECSLFIPVISANTQGRAEGYFRIEWDLAAERSRGIASGVPFILPVVIDETHDSEALVPDRFRAMQWTRLAGGEVSREVAGRFKKLWLQRSGVLAQPARGASPSDGESVRGQGETGKWRWFIAVGVAAVIAAAGLWKLRLGSRDETAATPVPALADSSAEDVLSRARGLIYAPDPIAEDVAQAEDMVGPLFSGHASDPEVATLAAEVSWAFIYRGFDVSEARLSKTQRLTERAVQLAPKNPAALYALGSYLAFSGTQPKRAEALLRQALDLAPKEARYACALYSLMAETKRSAEAAALRERMISEFPGDAQVAATIAKTYLLAQDIDAAEHWLDKSLALFPLTSVIVHKAQVMLEVHGDVAGMANWLTKVPERQRTNARVLNALVVQALVTGKTQEARRALEAVGDPWLNYGNFLLPRALSMAELDEVDGNADIARVEYSAALKEVRAMQSADPTDLRPMRAELWVHVGLGDRDSALRVLRMNLQRAPRPYRWTLSMTWWTSALRAALIMGERDQALSLLREAASTADGRRLLNNLISVDPKMAAVRADREVMDRLAGR